MEERPKKQKWGKKDTYEALKDVLLILTIVFFTIALIAAIKSEVDKKRNRAETDELRRRVQSVQLAQANADKTDKTETEPVDDTIEEAADEPEEIPVPSILPEYAGLYEENSDLAGWLFIEDTVIDYPVMQTFDDPWYYLNKSFSKNNNANGSLFADPDCSIGEGTKAYDYLDGAEPGTNIIIYGHRMNNGDMFGGLGKYLNKDYGLAHNIICFDSLYEHRKYELIAVFKSRIFYSDEDVFKYYQFTEAKTKEEFDASCRSIKELAVYDTGVEAEWGDEFITLSTCDYYTSNGRLVVVAKRVE